MADGIVAYTLPLFVGVSGLRLRAGIDAGNRWGPSGLLILAARGCRLAAQSDLSEGTASAGRAGGLRRWCAEGEIGVWMLGWAEELNLRKCRASRKTGLGEERN